MTEKKMCLKKIELLGFKSFADKTTLTFHEGITVIVGPNGCGKSNISDSFRWVLGEQSAKSLRGSKMHDVIFSGANTRKPLNIAEVTLTMSEIDGMLSTEYEEVAVTRRVHRSGEGEYLINKKSVRAKDVQDLFMGSGIGKDTFAIIAQNQMEKVINNSPLERRFIFEQASGIERFIHRKNEALRKLEQTEANVERVKDIHKEVERQIIVLEQQAEVARMFKENKAELDFLELALMSTKWENLQNRSESTKSKADDKQNEMNSIVASMQGEEEELHQAKKKLTEGQLELQSKKEEVYKRRSEKEIKSKEWQANQQRLQEVLHKEKRWLQELDQLIEKRKQWKNEAENNGKQLGTIEQELQVLERSRTENRDKLTHLESEVTKIREKQHYLHQELVRLLKHESESASELKQDGLRLEHNQERKRHLIDRKERLADQIQEITENFEAKKESVESWTDTVDQQKKGVLSLDVELKTVLHEIDENKKKLDVNIRELTENRARQKVLLRIREQMEGFSVGSKRLLKESTTAGSSLFNKVKGLYESITPAKGSEKALSVVMRPYSQTLVVEKQDDLQAVINFARENNLRDYSIVCLEQLTQNTAPLAEGAQLLDQVLDNHLSRHFLRNIYVTENAQEAFQLMRNAQGVEVWTQDGAYIDQRGVIFYSVEGDNNIFIREAELNTLEKKIREKEESQNTLEDALNALSQKRMDIQNRKVELEKLLRQEEMKLVEANFTLQRFRTDLSKFQAEQLKLEEELRSIDGVSEKLKQVIHDLKQKHAEAAAKAEEMREQESALTRELVERMAYLQSQQSGLREIEPRYQRMLEDQRKINHHLNVLEVKEMESQQQEKHLQDEIKSMQLQQNQIQGDNSEFQQTLEEVEKNLADVLANTSEFEKEVTHRRHIIDEIERKISVNRHVLKQVEQDYHQFGILSAQLESSRLSLENELNERFHQTIQELKEKGLVLESTIEKAERDIRGLRRKIEEAGDINMTSIEECDKHKERYSFLSGQIEDLETSKKELVEIITQLDSESRKIFQETFEKIQQNFKKNYQILFNGGEADLQLTESADVLEAGVEIVAKPPGKQMRSITLLSGGEKCLTALALLFAIFEVKPAPFCVLDEIDAPLDESNVERFLNMVKQFVSKCQFIIITHNKRTMSIADVIFGVSMQEKGVSKILSLEFSNEKAPEPALVE
jgi:chromosome segregation protein